MDEASIDQNYSYSVVIKKLIGVRLCIIFELIGLFLSPCPLIIKDVSVDLPNLWRSITCNSINESD